MIIFDSIYRNRIARVQKIEKPLLTLEYEKKKKESPTYGQVMAATFESLGKSQRYAEKMINIVRAKLLEPDMRMEICGEAVSVLRFADDFPAVA